mmetsp:Transcript_35992/g.84033  ORF Transcript_35992/g.84033 Transcript_35992/m.84033 type:complete len:123 (-) Transcript_35992:407-775(-)
MMIGQTNKKEERDQTKNEKINESEDENIYNDLPLDICMSSSHKIPLQGHTRSGEGNSFNQSIKKGTGDSEERGLSVTRGEFEKLQNENDTLRRNICLLYRTALAEMNRKDKLIASLRERLDR